MRMTVNPTVALWARTGLIWFLATMAFGMYLGLTQQFGASSPHAHLGLLGWLSSIAFAFLWSIADPEAQLARRARYHWAVHNLGMLLQVSSLWLVIKTGNGIFGLFIALGGLILILATLWLATMLWPRLGGR
jgi:hypothetical protein